LNIFPCASSTVPAYLVSFLREQFSCQSPLGDSSQKWSSFKANFLLPVSCKQLLLVPFCALISWKFRITVTPENSQIMFACTSTAQTAATISLPSFSKHKAGLPAPPEATPPPPPTPKARGSQVDLLQSSSQGNQSIVDLPLSVQPIPDSVPADVKLFSQKFPSILHTGNVVPNPSHEVEHHIHTGRHPPVIAKAGCLDLEKLELPRWNSNVWNLPVMSAVQHHHGRPLHMVPQKRWVLVTL
jgi:hypothetical protein